MRAGVLTGSTFDLGRFLNAINRFDAALNSAVLGHEYCVNFENRILDQLHFSFHVRVVLGLPFHYLFDLFTRSLAPPFQRRLGAYCVVKVQANCYHLNLDAFSP